MTKKERREFDRALEDFDHTFARLDRSLDLVLALGAGGSMIHDEDEEDEEDEEEFDLDYDLSGEMVH